MGRQALTQEQFVAKAKAVHGDRYDYSLAIYAGSHANLTIVCREHGEFYPKPTNLLQGTGCPHCANQARAKRLSSDIHGRRISEGRAAAKAERDRKQPFGETPALTALPFWTTA